LSILEELHVLSAESDCAGLGLGCWNGILAWVQQEEEGNHYEICQSCRPWGVLAIVMFGDAPNDMCRQYQLGLWGWVITFVCLQESGELEVEVFGPVVSCWVGTSSQHNILSHMMEGSS
jgi:hypothetical protein